jgi:tRNA pseudouridine55 synthase
LATGLLPIALGEATKTVAYVMAATKCYWFTIRWGQARDSDDAEGRVTAESPIRPDATAIERALAAFTGDIEQVPPVYSAIKVHGQRAYDLARADLAPDLAPRRIRIDRLRLIGAPESDRASFEMVCGKGAYVRALARDLALSLGTVGYVESLRRVAVGRFTLADSISLAELATLTDSGALADRLISVERGLTGVAVVAVTADQAARLGRGQAVVFDRAAADLDRGAGNGKAVACAMMVDRPIALVELDGGGMRPVRVFNW